MSRPEEKDKTFHGLGIAPDFLKRLEELKFYHPTPIQLKSIPISIQGEDMIGIAQTGTGKTLAFSLPALQRVAATKKMCLVLAPTRELALQVEETMHKLGSAFGLRSVAIIGGVPVFRQVKALRSKPHVIVATPGRLIDLVGQKKIRLDKVGILILDEADRMLDMGFEPQIRQILATVPEDRQTMLFSATMPEKITSIARKYMKKPLRVEVARAGSTADQIDQEVFIVPKSEKGKLLLNLLGEYKGTVLVFSRTKHGAKKIARAIRNVGHSSTELHSNRTLAQRRKSLEGFKSGEFRVLVATDIAARGIDVTNIELVINYDLPDNPDDYVHRIGRTGRAGSSGKAISFASPDQKRDLQTIEKLIRTRIPTIPVPEGIKEVAFSSSAAPKRRGRGGHARSGGGRSSGGRSSSGGQRGRSGAGGGRGGSSGGGRKHTPKRSKRS
ncbi:DEAD/DEAH box helicase [Candidatus Uhrbacteria bacterium]|nr:DEAD/DEAH box helicase [Candidatus Uhrbacteria bacterium]